MEGLKQWKSIRSTLDGRPKTVDKYRTTLDRRPKTVEKYQEHFRWEA